MSKHHRSGGGGGGGAKAASSGRATIAKTLTGIRGVQSSVTDLVERTRPLSTIVGMAPISFHGTAAEDVNVFITECDKARRYNKWPGRESVVRLAYYLDGNARYAFEAEVTDRADRLRQADGALKPKGAGAVGRPSPGVEDDDDVDRQAAGSVTLGGLPGAVRPVKAEGSAHGGLPGMEQAGAQATPCGLPNAAPSVGQTAPERHVVAWKRVLAGTRGRIEVLNTALATCDSALQDSMAGMLESTEALKDFEVQHGDPSGVEQKDDEKRAVEHSRLEAEMERTRDQFMVRVSMLQKELKQLHADKAVLHAEEVERAALLAEAEAVVTAEAVAAAVASATSGKGKETEAAAAVVDVTEEDDTALAFPTFESFCTWLREMFEREDVTNAFMSEFYGRRQERGERVQDFAYDVLRLSKRSGMKVSEEERCRHFLHGLTRRMRLHIQREWASKGTTSKEKWNWNSLMQRARRLERDIPELTVSHYDDDDDFQARRKKGSVVASSVAVEQHDESEDEAEPEKIQGTAMSVKAEAVTTSSVSELMSAFKEMMTSCLAVKAAEACHSCGSAAHVTAACPVTMQSKVKCFNCQQMGHFARACPQRVMQQTARPQGQFRGPANPVQRAVQCYACKEVGHYANACPNRKAPTAAGAAGLVCYNCNEAGHTSRTCPKRRRMAQAPQQRRQGNGNRA